MAVAPRPGASKRATAEQAVESFEWNGQTFTFRFNDISARLVKECREVTGHAPMALFSAISESSLQDLDVVAALIWVCQRQAGEEADYEALLDEVTYESLDTFGAVDTPPEVAGSPEA